MFSGAGRIVSGAGAVAEAGASAAPGAARVGDPLFGGAAVATPAFRTRSLNPSRSISNSTKWLFARYSSKSRSSELSTGPPWGAKSTLLGACGYYHGAPAPSNRPNEVDGR